MNSTFHTKSYILGVLFFVNSFVFAQDQPDQVTQEASKEITKNDWQKLGFGAIEYAQPFTTGNSFFGLGLEGKNGYNLKVQFFIYKHIFISGTMGTSHFNVINQSLVGNYNKTTLNHQFLSLGYEFIPFKKLRTGLSFSILGDTEYKNMSKTNTREAFQKDEGKVKSYNAYLDYMFNDDFALYISYTYRNDKTNILTAPETQSFFKSASFYNIAIGIKLYFGQDSILPKVFN